MKTNRRSPRAGIKWTEEELEYLGDKYGLISDSAICRRLGRSPGAIKHAAIRKLHISRKMNFYSARDLARVLGIPSSNRLINWVDAGWLCCRRSVVRQGQYRVWRFLEMQVVRFLKAKPWLFDPKGMPEHYFRSIVQKEYQRDPWYTCQEAAALLGVKSKDAVRRYIWRGWLPALKKPGGPWQGQWVIRRSAIDKFLADDPRPESRHQAYSLNSREAARKHGGPFRLSVAWSVLCPGCGQTVVVRADPSLGRRQVQQLFIAIYVNGVCKHGLVCSLARTQLGDRR